MSAALRALVRAARPRRAAYALAARRPAPRGLATSPVVDLVGDDGHEAPARDEASVDLGPDDVDLLSGDWWTPDAETAATTRSLNIALAGAPNAGKSELLNALCGKKLAAVSRKRHCTRMPVMGVTSCADSGVQLVFTDTPGLPVPDPDRKATRDRVRPPSAASIVGHLAHVDAVVIVVDAARRVTQPYLDTHRALLRHALSRGDACRPILCLNKVDLVRPKTKLLELARQLHDIAAEETRAVAMAAAPRLAAGAQQQARVGAGGDAAAAAAVAVGASGDEAAAVAEAGGAGDEATTALAEADGGGSFSSLAEAVVPARPDEWVPPMTFMVSALENDGLDDLTGYLREVALPAEWDFEAHETTTMTGLEWTTELIREHLLEHLHDELPYVVEQANARWEMQGGVLVVDQDIVVENRFQKATVIGAGGARIRRIRDAAEADMIESFGTSVRLSLSVKAKRRVKNK